MGYCLLYEAMLPSILWARDKYLSPNGLVAPSHTSLVIALFSDPDFMADHITFWEDVYGFSMTSMLSGIYDEVLIRETDASTVASSSDIFLHLPLHQVHASDLVGFEKDFSLTVNKDIDSLDGFTIWFDTFFATTRQADPAHTGLQMFTTGPHGKPTHWKQGILLIDHKKCSLPLQRGQIINGRIKYESPKAPRHLDIRVTWSIAGTESSVFSQVWKLE